MQNCKCDNCGANLTFEENNWDFIICQYCGSKKMLDDCRITHRNFDEAEVIKAKTEYMVKSKEIEWAEADRAEKEAEKNRKYNEKRLQLAFAQQMEKRKLILKIFSFVVIVILAILGIIFIKNNQTEVLGSILIIAGIALAIFVIVYLPKKIAEKEALIKGGIRFPAGLEPINEKSLEVVKSILVNAGFKNISEISKHDVLLGIFVKQDAVESIMINGENAKYGNVYLPDDHIIITYHGK